MVRRRSRQHETRHLHHASVDAGGSLADAEVLAAGSPSRWSGWWSSLPAQRRRTVAVAAATALATAAAALGAALLPDWLDERERREAVVLTASLGVWASSTSPPGGQVIYYLSIRNGGEAPLEVTAVLARDDQVVLRARDAVSRPVAAGNQALLPLSVLLTCKPGTASSAHVLRVQIDIRRADGTTTRRSPVVGGAGSVLAAADTLCEVRPELVGYELSGPVLRPAATEGGVG